MLWEWAWKIGRWFGVEVRVHLVFIIYVIFELLSGGLRGGAYGLGFTAMVLGMLFGIVLLHEYGHCFASRVTGGHADRILLWPLGGLAYVSAAHLPTPQLIVAIGGPLVNVGFLLLLTPYFLLQGGAIGSYFLQMAPAGNFVEMFYAINLDLLLFNLIPAFPMDGGRILRSLLWYRIGELRATLIAVYLGRAFAALLLLGGLMASSSGTLNGTMLVFLAVFLFFAGEQEKQRIEGRETGWEGYAQRPAPRSVSLPGVRWFRNLRSRQAHRRAERAARERIAIEQRVDELLDKVSREGLQSLSSKERRFLENASRHYRSK